MCVRERLIGVESKFIYLERRVGFEGEMGIRREKEYKSRLKRERG